MANDFLFVADCLKIKPIKKQKRLEFVLLVAAG
jgi:hypothetical protein